MQIELVSKAQIAASAVASSIKISSAEYNRLLKLDFNDLLADPVNMEFERRARQIMAGTDIKYIYIEAPLAPDHIKYWIRPGEEDTYGMPAGTPLDVVYLLDAVVDEKTRREDTGAQGYTDQDRYTPTYPDRAQLYNEFEPALLDNNDEWGHYLTGYAPLFFSEGSFLGFVGVDLLLDHYEIIIRNNLISTLIYCLVVCLLCLIAFYYIYRRIRENLYIDPLTGLLNWRHYQQVVKRTIKHHPDATGIMLMLNVAQFWRLNQNYGIEASEKLLTEVGARLRETQSRHSILARTSTHTFGIYYHNIQPGTQEATVHNLLTALSKPYLINRIQLNPAFTCGVSIYSPPGKTGDAHSIEELSAHAQFSLMTLSSKEVECIQYFVPEDYQRFKKQVERRQRLPGMIAENNFSVVFEPIIDVINADIFGYEGLSRLKDPSYGGIIDAITDAAAMGLSAELDNLLARNVIQKFVGLNSDKYLFINQSPYFLPPDAAFRDLFRTLQGSNFLVEFTEHEAVDFEHIQSKIDIIRSQGGFVGIDDFGSGYANEIALLEMNPDIIKIDLNLIRNINSDEKKQMLVENIIRFAISYGIRTLAEGIETEAEMKTCIRLGINLIQGYYFTKPSIDLYELSPEQINKIQALWAEIVTEGRADHIAPASQTTTS